MTEVIGRAARAIDRIAGSAGPGAAMAAVTHAEVVRGLVLAWLGGDLDAFDRLQVDTASLTVVDLAGDGAVVRTVNDTAHLTWGGVGTADDGVPVRGSGGGPVPLTPWSPR